MQAVLMLAGLLALYVDARIYKERQEGRVTVLEASFKAQTEKAEKAAEKQADATRELSTAVTELSVIVGRERPRDTLFPRR